MKVPESNTNIQNKVSLLKALGDETRLSIVLLLLQQGKKTVTEITEHVNRAQPTVSLNLKVLENCGLLRKKRQGRLIFYRLRIQRIRPILEALGLGGQR